MTQTNPMRIKSVLYCPDIWQRMGKPVLLKVLIRL